jgi:hypothetical protein
VQDRRVEREDDPHEEEGEREGEGEDQDEDDDQGCALHFQLVTQGGL